MLCRVLSVDTVVSDLLDIPLTHSEHPQIVRYPRAGGYYTEHMDTSEDRLLMSVGPGRSQIEGERVSVRRDELFHPSMRTFVLDSHATSFQ